MFPQHCFRNNVSSLAGALTPDTCTERVMPGVEFASDCSGDARAAFLNSKWRTEAKVDEVRMPFLDFLESISALMSIRGVKFVL